MFKYWEKIDRLYHINRLLLIFAATLALIIVGLLLTLATTPKRYEFWLTPTQAANGGLLQAGHIPDQYIQGFVATLLPTMNTWSQRGNQEFSNKLSQFHYYFTPHHRTLMETMHAKYKEAQLFNRTQIATLYRFMQDGDVKSIGKNTWEVHLLVRITQRLKDESPLVIADKMVDYHVRVVKVNLSPLQNPFQLALDGYTQPERLIKDFLASSSEEK